MFAVLGVRVTLIEKRDRLLEFADREIIEALSYHLRDGRVTLRLGEEVESVEELTDGTVVANLKSKKRVSGDALLYAVGRQGNIDDLNLAAAGLEADNRGRIPVDEHYQTKVEHIYAVGDVVGFPSLASVSMEQGRIAAARAFNDRATTSNPGFYPYGIYTIPEISFIGKTEEQLTDEDVPYEVGMAYYREVARGQIRGDTTGTAEADLPSRHAQGAGGAHHRRGSQRAGAHRSGGDDPGRHGGLLRRHRLQLPDAGGVLQGSGFQRAGPPAPLPGGVKRNQTLLPIPKEGSNDYRHRRCHDRTHRGRQAGRSAAGGQAAALSRRPNDRGALAAIPSSELVELLVRQHNRAGARTVRALWTPSGSPSPASSATAWWRTRPICRRSKECGWPTS